MDDRFNTIAGWALFAGIVGLGLTSVSSRYFQADKPHRPETMGYAIEGVEAEGGAGAAAVPLATLLASADVAKGEAVFAKCGSCHTITQGGANGIGPNLYAVLGEGIAAGRGGFAFSDALKTAGAAKGGKWSFEAMDEWLTSPKAFAPGTKMTFAGLTKPEDRANLLAYLNAQGSNLPLPAAPAAAPAGEAAAAGAPAVAAADPVKGEAVFGKCKSCHTVNAGGANGIGPNLHGTYGASVGGKAGFAFSDALKGKGGTWDDATLDAWLTSPRAFAAGTKMTFAGLTKPEDRANVIAYLKAQK